MSRRKKSTKVQVPIRMEKTFRTKLANSAKARKASMNAEIVQRLERSYEIEKRLGGPQLVELIEILASVMKTTGERAGFAVSTEPYGGEWLRQPFAYDQAVKGANRILEHFRPVGEVVLPEPYMSAVVALAGTGLDQTARGEELLKLMAELGSLMADRAIKNKEQADE